MAEGEARNATLCEDMVCKRDGGSGNMWQRVGFQAGNVIASRFGGSRLCFLDRTSVKIETLGNWREVVSSIS